MTHFYYFFSVHSLFLQHTWKTNHTNRHEVSNFTGQCWLCRKVSVTSCIMVANMPFIIVFTAFVPAPSSWEDLYFLPECFHPQDLKANSPNWWPYKPWLPIPENSVFYQDTIPWLIIFLILVHYLIDILIKIVRRLYVGHSRGVKGSLLWRP